MVAFIALAAVLQTAGWPGPESRADYRMDIRLLPDSVLVRGSTEITFIPAFPADTLWLHLYPNAYRDPSTAFATDQAEWGDYSFAEASDDGFGWIALDGWTLDGDSIQVLVDETLGFIPLDSAAAPGDTLVLAGRFDVKVPTIWSRMGHDGDHYEMSQWYPKMCVLDDRGWHLSRYHSEGEFYGDYGSYDVTLALPDSMVTAATGHLDSIGFSPDSSTRVERWVAGPVHDFAWVADPAFMLLEHNFIYPDSLGGNIVRIHVAAQEDEIEEWEDAGAWTDSTLLYCGEWYGPYPYDDLWVVQSAFYGGMEYPQLVLIGRFDMPFGRYFEMVVMHEVGHQWFYGLLGNDEVDEAWLDEGINSFSEIRYFERKYGLHGNMTTLPGWISDNSDADGTSASYAGMVAGGEEVPVLSTSTEASGGRYDYGALYYSKPALFMRMLQNSMGGETFDRFMHILFDRFAFHHPRTEDVQAIAEEVSGRPWQAEFDTWLRTTASADVRVDDISWTGDSTVVTVSGDIPLPVELDLELTRCGASVMRRIGLEPGRSSTISVPGHWRRAEVDPETRYLDRNPWNNSLPEAGRIRPMLIPYEQPSRFNTWLLPLPGWADGTWEAGLFGMTRAASTRSGGPLDVSGIWRQPLGGDRAGISGISLEIPLDRSPNSGSTLAFDYWSGYGRGLVSLGASWNHSGPYPSDPSHTLWSSISFEGVGDDPVLDAGEYSAGSGAVIQAGASRWEWTRSGARWGHVSLCASPSWDGEEWVSASFEGTLTLSDLPFDPGTRLFAGRVWGDAPLQHLYRPGGGLQAGGVMGWILPPDGDISPSEHYFVESGPALPGYGDDPARGRIGIALGETLKMPVLPLTLFADAGWIEGSSRDLTAADIISDAGIGVNAGFVQAWFPAWVSDPLPGDDQWELRWRLAFSLWGLPFMFF